MKCIPVSGTPGGEMLRRYWHPIGFSTELKGRPKRRRLLGEDLVLFRDDQGRLGLLELRCLHRGTSLEFGHIEDGGLRCCYHGWLYDVDGRVLEQPGEPPDSSFKERICNGLTRFRSLPGLSLPTSVPTRRRSCPATMCWCEKTEFDP